MRRSIQLVGVGLLLFTGLAWAQGMGTGAELSEFLVADETEKIARVNLVAGESDVNQGLNFNGYANGEVAIIIPQGWRVEVVLTNPSSMPHSAAIVPPDTLELSEEVGPAFPGAVLPVLPTGATEDFSFVADEVGEYNLICPVAEHAPLGMWLRFVVSDEVSAPEISFVPEL